MEVLGPRAGSPPDAAALATRAVRFLRGRPGRPVCESCLALEVDSRNPLVMRAVWRSLPESVAHNLVQIDGTCSRCLRSAPVIYASVV